ncbi:MAG TPA: alpha/beta fold hydrolase [Candidatus Binatia bacterium]|nr:alpha/beta fold hydrolase [Candidatus Binatia bacterium]
MILLLAAALMSGCQLVGRSRDGVRSVDHRVPHVSTVPANKGQPVQIFVRETTAASVSAMPRPVVLMVHGEFSPSTIAFDVNHSSYSWMSYLARAGFDVFAMDLTGYGRSARPKMNDPCNVGPAQQKMLMPKTLKEPCTPSYGYQLVNRESEHDELDRVIEYIRKLRGVSRVNLLGWSRGGYRIGTYTIQHPEKVDKLVIFASSNYSRQNPSAPPSEIPRPGFPMTIESREVAEQECWLPSAKCADQVEPGIPNRIWRLRKQTDPDGMTWGPGVMRAPTGTYWGWNAAEAKRIKVPTLIIVGEFDPLEASNRELYEDLGAESKVFVSIACGSHFAVWEKSHTLLHEASRMWLTRGSFNGATRGEFKMSLGN